MIFNSKQLEELENIHDSTGAFEEEADDDSGFDDVGEAAMDWRRGIIEEAAESVKRAKTRPVESSIQYTVGSLLFDRDARRFARVQRSVPGYLKIVYLSGGDREYGTLDVVAYLREYGAQKRVSEMSEQLAMPEADVVNELERLGITPLEEPEPTEEQAAEPNAAPQPAASPRTPPKPPRGKIKIEEVEEEDEEDDEELLASDEDEVADDDLDSTEAEALADDDFDEDEEPETNGKGKGKAAKPAAGKAAVVAKGKGPQKQPAAAKAKPAAPAAKSVDKRPPEKKAPEKAAKAAPKNEKKPERPAAKTPAPKADAQKKAAGKGVNPIDDPNGFIKANFGAMSNRELARLTGLSEHTIRRKLGEWGLKRKKGEE